MRIEKVLLTAVFVFAVSGVAGAADSVSDVSDGGAVRSAPGSTSTYKVRMALNYPGGAPEASPEPAESKAEAGDVDDIPYAGTPFAQPSHAQPPYADTPYAERLRSESYRPDYNRLERERAELERVERELARQLERERRESEEREERERAEKERLERERLENERLERERAERERQERERLEKERLEAERVERERLERERAGRERMERERAERERREQAGREYRERSRGESLRIGSGGADGYGIGDSFSTLVTIEEFPTDSLGMAAPAAPPEPPELPGSSEASELPEAPEPALPEKPEPRILATLYGEPITEEDVAREMWLRRGRETFDWLIGRDILKRELDRLGLKVADAEVGESLDKHLAVLRKAYPKLRKRDDLTRAASGMTLDEYRERTVWTELALRRVMRASLDTRDDDLRRYFATVRADYVRPERVLVSQIFIPPQVAPDADGIADARAWDDAERQIREAYAMLRREDFADVARLYGSGGRISGWVKRGDLLRELEGPAFSIGPGSITTPIRSSMGWHMLMVEEREERREPELAEVMDEVRERFEEERFVRLAGEFMARLKEKALGSGGLVLVDEPGVFVESQR